MDSLADIDEVVHRPSREFVESTNVWAFMQEYDIADYDELIERTTREVEGVPESGLDWFWGLLPDYLDLEFDEPFDAVRDDSRGPQFTDWYVGGTLNIAHNTVERHAERGNETRNKVACLWEGESGRIRAYTYHDLARESAQVANALAERGIGEGDTVAIYMPMIPEVVSVLYGIFRAGAVAVPIFSGFGADATATRLEESGASVLLTADGFERRGKPIRLKAAADEALSQVGGVESVIVVDNLGLDAPVDESRDESWAAAVKTQSGSFETRSMDATDPCMVLYSSGTTGRPKGVVHCHAGALVQPAKEIHFGFDQKPADRFWWVSDIGWMMGPWSLIGNHAFGGTVVMYEGAPDYPEPDRLWDLVERHDVTQFGVSPTAVRALRDYGDEYVERHDLSSLRLLGSTGEPWDPENWRWFYEKVGGGEAPIANISGGTEIIGCFLMPMPIQDLKPCTLGGPGLGMAIDVVDANGESVVDSGERGFLVARDSCPSMTRSLWEGDERYLDTYWSSFEDPPLWDHGDWAQVDADGFWFLHGRADDAINVAGRKVGPAEVEGALVDHPAVQAAGAVGVPDDTTGEAVVAYVVPATDVEPDDDLAAELIEQVGAELGKPFRPREIRFADALPKTQSGKVVRRALEGAYTGEDVGDRSSIENPEVLDDLQADE